MRLPVTLSLYITRQVLVTFMLCLALILFVVGLGELVEMLRRATHKTHEVPFRIIAEMVLMKLPLTVEQVLPFAVLAGGMLAFTRLSKTSELIVARAAGISAWQFLAPAALLAAAIGLFFITVFNPISSAMISRFEMLEGKYITDRPSTLSISPSGLWLRHTALQPELIMNKQVGEYILHAQRIDQRGMTMREVIVFLYDQQNAFALRIDAPAARLQEGYWYLEKATASSPGALPQPQAHLRLQTDLSENQIKESFASPKTLSFWELRSFIDTLEKAGFSALRHKLHWYSLLATPITLAAMLLLGALFSLRHHRRGKIGVMMALGIFAGFVVYFTTNLVYALGFSGSLPVVLAAFMPPLITLMIATAALLHFEDG